MTRQNPLWEQALTYPASLDRQLIASIWPRGGVTGGVVTAVSNTMNVSAAPGTAAVPLVTGQGCGLCRWDAAEVVTLAAAPGSGTSRIDLVIVQYRDSSFDGGGNNDFVVTSVTGTPAASNPAVPATPNNAFVLAQVTVPGAAANLNAATVTDARGSLLSPGVTDQAWSPMTALQNGWTTSGAGTTFAAGYRMVGGRVYFRGSIASGTMNQPAFTLPVAYRPTKWMQFSIVSFNAFGVVVVESTGNVRPATGSSSSVFLDSISFDTAP